MAFDYHQEIVEIMGNPAGKPADRFHFLGLAQLVFEQLAFADVLRNHQAHGASCIFQFVRYNIDCKGFACLVSVKPVAVVPASVPPLVHVSLKSGLVSVRTNIADGHAAEFALAVPVLFAGGFVDLQEAKSFSVEHPHGQWSVGKEQTKHGFAFANGFFRTDAFDGEGDVSAGGIEKFEVALVVAFSFW